MSDETGQLQLPAQAISRADNVAPVSASRKSATTAKVRGKRYVEHFAIPTDWWQIGPAMLLAAIANALNSWSFPGLISALVILLGAGGSFASHWMSNLERKLEQSDRDRYLLVAVSVGVPMLLFGMGMSLWAHGLAKEAHSVLVEMVGVSMVSAIICNGRLFAMIAANIGLWLGLAAVTLDPIALAVIAVSGAMGIRSSLKQSTANRIAQRQQEQVERTQHRAELILSDFEQTRQGWFWETDRRGSITYVSATIAEVLGRDTKAMIGRPFSELFTLDDQTREGERTLAFHMSTRSSFHELAVRAATKYEDERWWSINGLPVYDDYDNFQGFRGSGSDLTERRRSEEKVSRLAHYDSLTGLANRLQISQLLEKILTARNIDQRVCAVFLIDLDRFKQVNDTLGHPVGDALLTHVSQRLERVVDKAGRVGRLGGDEFQVVIPGHHNDVALAHIARQIIEALSQPYSIEGSSVVIGASLGIAKAPEHGVTSEALIRNADLALYAAKDGGRGRHHFYAADLHSDAEERRQMEQDLRDAIATGSLELYYQPVVSTTTEKVTGFEALLRWTHPVRGPLSPAKFIPIAEEAGLIAQIGEWALRTACMDMAQWPEDIRVAVNVSPLQFANPALPAIVTSALAAAQVAPHRLELEITESVFLNDSESTDAMFNALDRLGVRLALDDFGTGYSSLGYLKKAPFDKIKIDQSFVRGATIHGSRNGAIISSIVNLAEALDMETTAEGVETLDELDLIRSLGCSHVQGFIYAKPLTREDALALMNGGLSVVATGPRSARPPRQSMLRRVTLEHGGEKYEATIRNISRTGAMIHGLWNVPAGTVFNLELGIEQIIAVTARWSAQDRTGIEFSKPLDLDNSGRIILMPEHRRMAMDSVRLLKAG